jgi:hypothetical protein
MALSKQAGKPGWHVWVRVAGLTGLVFLIVGLVVWGVSGEMVPLAVAAVGAVLAGLAVILEIKGAAGLVLSRRGALGSNVFVQILLAAGLLAVVNGFSFSHYIRLDVTRDREHTIDPALREQLGRLRGETRILVYQRHTSFGQLADKQDNYDAAAERKIVEKVKDLAEQFTELGPRFRVEVLDNQEEGFEAKKEALKRDAPKLAEAVESTPEDSIFFYADGKVQRLAFQDVYQLDKVASQEANGGQGNLVLRYQGAGPFARRVLNIDEKQPRVAVGVIHEVLGLDAVRDIGMAGAKKALAARGFATRDLILRNWQRGGMPEAAVLTRDEFKYQRLEATLAALNQAIKGFKESLDKYSKQREEWSSQSAAELAKKYALVIFLGGPDAVERKTLAEMLKAGQRVQQAQVNEVTRRQYVAYLDEEWLPMERERLAESQKRQAEATTEQSGLNIESLDELRRLADLRAKLGRTLADCDLLILPQMTLFDVTSSPRERIQSWLHRLDNDQTEAVKEFLKAGKPVLFCLGPPNDPPGEPPPPIADRFDRVEQLVKDLGFKVPEQTILFNVETEALAEQQARLMLTATPTEVPPLRFELPGGAGKKLALSAPGGEPTPAKSSAIQASLRLAARSVGKKGSLDLRLRNPRPVYFDPRGDDKPDLGTAFLFTSADSWNESQPFALEDYTPKLDRPKADDPTRGTLSEERAGPFPIAAAVQEKLPASWYAEKGGTPATVRVAVIGHGGVFMGPALTPAKEKLLLDVTNWLLGRDDLLARNSQAWEYPRVDLTTEDASLWRWGMIGGLPLLSLYLMAVVLMVRRLR